MENEEGNKKVILNQYLNLNVSDWQQFLVYLPSDTIEGVYKLWIEAESMNRETNMLNNKSKIITITVTDKNRIIMPELKDMANVSLLEGNDYTQQLEMSKGTEPITYEIVSVPSSTISIDDSGLIKWIKPTVANYKVTAKAINNIGQDEKSWIVSVESKDTDNDGISDDVDLDDEVITKTITLSKGFGLYGMNSSMTLAQLIEKIGVDNLISINSNGETYQLSYVKEGLDMLNDFTQLEPFKSVWIAVANEVTITYDEIDYSNEEQEITLEGNRWYLLNPPKEISLETIKAQLGNSNIKVIQGISTTYQQQYIDDGIDWANDFTGFYEPLGYWILLKENATLKF
jgi:hypothetical protein